jgi:hypothetical protein
MALMVSFRAPYRAVAWLHTVTLLPFRNGPRPYRGNAVTSSDDPAPQAVTLSRSAAMRK